MSCYENIGAVSKPFQYIGHEENTYRKDFAAAKVRLCLAFPDAYEIGMSNVGMQILYHVVNEQEGYLCDRTYAPLVDMGAMLKATGQTLLARESERPLADFDCLGFTLQYELCYTNILYMLELAGLPRYASARLQSDLSYPLIMAGGPCTFNPEPVADFFDFIVIGEGEEVIIEVLAVIAAAKLAKLDRLATLTKLQSLAGVYVPAFYTPEYGAKGSGELVKLRRQTSAPKWIERRIVKDLASAAYPRKPVTPAIQPIHERIAVEIQRGCTRSCRFCQAGYVYRPRRERPLESVLEIIDASIASTGITDIGLLSLSSADYSQIHPLMHGVIERYKDRNLSVSLPSTRLDALAEEYLEVFKEERRTGFTIAPEAGSQRLRNVINKNFTEEEIVETARMLFRNGWQSIKMYFMIGQPTETDDDVIAIAELGNTVIKRCADIPGRKQLTISLSNFVPKPHTPFQWHAQITHSEILRKQALVRAHIAFRDRIQFRSHSADNSLAEGLLSRGDRRVSRLIEIAYTMGAVFDCWQERFDLQIWLAAAAKLQEETGYDAVEAGLRARDLSERLPWHRIHSGIHPKFFKNEWQKAVYGIATEDCSFAACHECGLCNEKNGVKPVVFAKAAKPLGRPNGEPAPVLPPRPEVPMAAPTRYRFQYKKINAAIFISTLDLQQLFIRAFTRANIRMRYDHGIRPRPEITMGPALPLGVSSQCEMFDIALDSTLDPPSIVAVLNDYLPADLHLLTGSKLATYEVSISQAIRAVSYKIDSQEILAAAGYSATPAKLAARVAAINTSKRLMVSRERPTREGEMRTSVLDLKDSLEALQWREDGLYFTLFAPHGQAVSPHFVLSAVLQTEANEAAPMRENNRQTLIQKTGFHGYTVGTRRAGGLSAAQVASPQA